MNNTIDFEAEADFENIKKAAGFQKLKELKEAQDKVVETSNFKVSLSEKDLHPEGVIFLDKYKLWLASSLHLKKIVAFDSKGVCSDWFTDTPYSIFSLRTDASQRYLWVTCSAMPEMKNFTEAINGRNEILKIDIKTRRLVKRYIADGKHLFGDIALAKRRCLYFRHFRTYSFIKYKKIKFPLRKSWFGKI